MTSISEAIYRAIGRLPTAMAVTASVAIYVGIGLALPYLLGASPGLFVALNVIGVVWASVVMCGFLIDRIIAAHRRNLVEWTTELRLLSSEEFEWLVGEVFRREGWDVKETGRSDGPDGNIDLELRRDGRRAIVQCKRWQSWPVGTDEIRNFLGTLMREHLPGSSGIFVTLSTYTDQARREGLQAALELIDNRELLRRVERVRREMPCPDCGASMLFGRSTRGWWFRCVQPRCSGKLDVGTDPGRAIEFLSIPPEEVRGSKGSG